MSLARCDGALSTDANGVPYCEDMLGSPLAWVAVEPFTIDDIDPETAGGFFAVGFVIYGTVFFMGRAIKVILDQVRRA